MNHTNVQREDATVDALNGLLRGELSAVESYDKALPALEDKARGAWRSAGLPGVARDARRADSPRDRAGGWKAGACVGRVGDVLAKAVAGGSRALGWKAVISTLEEGEDHGLKEDKDALPRLGLDEGVRHLIADELYPAATTHARRDLRAQARDVGLKKYSKRS